MKSITIALKDMGRAFRSLFALAFMFGIPILMTVLFGFLFGGVGEADSEFSIPLTDIIIVDLDEGSPYAAGFDYNDQTFGSFGLMLTHILEGENFSSLMQVTLMDEVQARAAVDDREAGLAIIIPQDFTSALIGTSEEQTSIEFYQDPELSLGPEICQSIVMGIVDDFSTRTLSMDTVATVLAEQGITLSAEEQLVLMQTLTQASSEAESSQNSGIEVIPPKVVNEKETSLMQTIMRSIMGGMMIFYAFYTGTSIAETILEEEENGTLSRLFISPTDVRTVLNGKFLAGFLMTIVQVSLLLLFGNLVFGIKWGSLPLLVIFAIGLVSLATSFGIFVISLVKSTRQGGIVYGAVLTFTGMLGISSVFTQGTGAEAAFDIIPLAVPQGWAMSALESAWKGDLENTLLYTGGMLILAALFFFIGNARFKKRFA
jgi:ABC-2 type transport system permease protein